MRSVSNAPNMAKNTPRTSDGAHASRGFPGPWWLPILAVYTPVVAYLFRPVQHTGDGAAYTLQALHGPILDRAVHGGWLVPLSPWTRALAALGINPSAATNAASVLAMGAALLLMAALAAELVREAGDGRRGDALLAPTVALCSVAVWDAALFAEIYGPLAALCLGAVFTLRRGAVLGAASLLFLTWATHPGSLALLPGLAVLGTPPGRTRSTGWAFSFAVALSVLWVFTIGVGEWLGPRGLMAPGADVSTWHALQRAWRLLARDLGGASLPLLAGAAIAWTRRTSAELQWLKGCGVLLLGTILVLDRFSDNPAALPLLLLCCPLAALAPAGLRELAPRGARAGAALLVLLMVLGVTEAATREDAVVRAAARNHENRASRCEEPTPDEVRWRERMLLDLACDH